jgi:hypothetical protein
MRKFKIAVGGFTTMCLLMVAFKLLRLTNYDWLWVLAPLWLLLTPYIITFVYMLLRLWGEMFHAYIKQRYGSNKG